MRTADSLRQLLQKAYDTLPLSQRAAGDIKLDRFADVLVPVLSLSATPFRDRIIDFQLGQLAVTLGVGNTGVQIDVDAVPVGQIHRYLNLSALSSGVTSDVGLEVISNAIRLRYGLKALDQNARANLLAPAGIDLAGALDADFGLAGSDKYLDVFPGGVLRAIFSNMANTEVATFIALRVRMHGPRTLGTDLAPQMTPTLV